MYAGKILTIETLPVRLTSPDGKRPVVDADQTCYFEDNAGHVLYMTRIFYCYGTVHEEVIGRPSTIIAVASQYQQLNPLFTYISVAVITFAEGVMCWSDSVSLQNI